ncbi:DUF4185 domain-containing protein [Nakamurella lactea]|uniref:DUF4185 domain-containing protein n=1 Tax=Nakamurella lactea TaxID=459515 RepID=UPI0003F84A29|nr:DUF4185 domain-containing protein [Nakamurella lactea]
MATLQVPLIGAVTAPIRSRADRRPPRRSRRQLVGAATALLLGIAGPLLAPVGAQATPVGPGISIRPAAAPVGHGTGNSCSLARSTITATAGVDTVRTDRFTAFGNAGGGADGDGWSGADSTYSAPISGGRLAWIFSDTFLGPVAADGSRPTSSPFLNNSIVIEKNGTLTTVHGGTATDPTALVPPDDPDSWYWFGDGIADRSGRQLDVVALKFAKFGPGIWDWSWSSNSLVRFDTRTWQRSAILPLPSSAGIQWSSWIQRQGRDLLVYGVEDLGAQKYLHLAKVIGGDLAATSTWRYWDGSHWSATETDSARILDHVANEMSVTPFRDGYLAVTQDTTVPFDATIRGYVACNPQGPFTDIGTLYSMPETGPAGSYGDPNVFAYNAHEHPELRRGNSIYLTYNVNTLDNPSLYRDASIYRPRFVKVDLAVTAPHRSTPHR